MRSTTSSLLVLLCVAWLAVTPARAADEPCSARLQQAAPRGEWRYAPFSAGDAGLTLDIGWRDAANCRLALTVQSQRAQSMGLGDAQVRYLLRDALGQELRADGVQRLVAQAGPSTSTQLMVLVPPGQSVRPGTYQDRLLIQLLDGDRVLDVREILAELRVEAQASVAAAGSAAAGFQGARGAVLDFGSLESGKEREAFLFVRSNSSYALRLRSENGGSLRREGAATAKEAIRYRAALDSQWFDLQQPIELPGHAPRSGLAPPHRLRAKIGTVENAVAGNYRDVITVDVVLLE